MFNIGRYSNYHWLSTYIVHSTRSLLGGMSWYWHFAVWRRWDTIHLSTCSSTCKLSLQWILHGLRLGWVCWLLSWVSYTLLWVWTYQIIGKKSLYLPFTVFGWEFFYELFCDLSFLLEIRNIHFHRFIQTALGYFGF